MVSKSLRTRSWELKSSARCFAFELSKCQCNGLTNFRVWLRMAYLLYSRWASSAVVPSLTALGSSNPSGNGTFSSSAGTSTTDGRCLTDDSRILQNFCPPALGRRNQWLCLFDAQREGLESEQTFSEVVDRFAKLESWGQNENLLWRPKNCLENQKLLKSFRQERYFLIFLLCPCRVR